MELLHGERSAAAARLKLAYLFGSEAQRQAAPKQQQDVWLYNICLKPPAAAADALARWQASSHAPAAEDRGTTLCAEVVLCAHSSCKSRCG
jgi:hypothetical protein